MWALEGVRQVPETIDKLLAAINTGVCGQTAHDVGDVLHGIDDDHVMQVWTIFS